MVNLEWYRTFKAIYQNGNLTRASEELLISQPNVSIQLASLESYIGHKLFERHPRKLVPTAYGELLYAQVVGSIENLERVETEFRKVALKRAENLRIGSPIEYAHNILLDKLASCETNVVLKFGFTGELRKALDDKEIDFAIVTQKIEDDNIVHVPLVEENFMIIAHATYDAVELEKNIVGDDMEAVEQWLLGQDWIAYDGKLSIIRRFWRENFKKRPLIKPRFIIPDINMIIKAVHLRYGIAVVSDLLVGDSLARQQLKILWKGNNVACNQLWLTYNSLAVEEKQVETIKNVLGLS